MKHAILLFLLSMMSAASRADIPILGFWGVNPESATKARYTEMRRAGFDVSMDGYKTLEQIIHSLDCAQAAGMKLLVAGDQLVLHPQETAKAIRNTSCAKCRYDAAAGFFGRYTRILCPAAGASANFMEY